MKRTKILAFLGMTALAAGATPLTPQQALSRMSTQGPAKVKGIAPKTLKLEYTERDENQKPSLYVFNRDGNQGFIVVSADDVAVPVAGYSDRGSFDAENIPDNMKWWLAEYSRELQYAIQHGVEAYTAPQTRADDSWAEIQPMVSTRWNQSSPYNGMTPVGPNGKNCVTGCVATAMAQIMKFWNYPTRGTGSITYTCKGLNKDLSMDFSAKAFDWTNMKNIYGTADYNGIEADAVAYLMKSCGYGVRMNYTESESGAVAYYVGDALINNFSYNPNMSYESRDFYSVQEWNKMVYDELAAGRPQIYGGQSGQGGHQFVCDGYKDGFFHINWGWGGVADGYFSLQLLNPSQQGIGAGGTGGYRYQQDVIKNLQPTAVGTRKLRLSQTGTVHGKMNSGNIEISFGDGSTGTGAFSWCYHNITGYLGVIVTDSSGKQKYLPSFRIDLPGLKGYSKFNMNGQSTLADGEYKVTVATATNIDDSSTWSPTLAPAGGVNYFYLTKSGANISVRDAELGAISVSSAALTTSIYNDSPVMMEAKFENTSSQDATDVLVPVLLKSNYPVYEGPEIEVNIPAGKTVDFKDLIRWHLAPGASSILLATNFDLRFRSRALNDYTSFSTTARMLVNTGSIKIKCDELKVPGAQTTETTDINGTAVTAYVVDDFDRIPFEVKITNTGGRYFALDCYVNLYKHSNDDVAEGSAEITPLPMVGYGKSCTGTTVGSLDAGFSQDLVCAQVYYKSTTGEMVQMDGPLIYVMRTRSGVDGVSSGSGIDYNEESRQIVCSGAQEITVYNIAGSQIAAGQGTTLTLPTSVAGPVVVKARTASSLNTLKLFIK